MRFYSTLLAGAALVASVFAVEINEAPSNAEVGKTYTIKYSPADNTPTTFILRQGPSDDLGVVTTLTTTATGGTFEWTVDTALPNGADYALEIKQGTGPSNYIGPFSVSGSSASAKPSSSSASSTASSSRSSSGSSSGSSSSSASETSSASTTLTTTASSNSTASSPTLSSTGNGTASFTASRTPTGTATGTTAQGAPQNTGAASALGSSPLALIFGVVGAMAYLN